MIKFFRKIRQKLISENKFSKYLIYAIGEIVLVVIGILIALSINNWNEDRKLKQLKREYLYSLKRDLTADLTLLNEALFYAENDIKTNAAFASRLSSSNATIDTLKIIARYEFNPIMKGLRTLNQNTYNSLITTGNIELLGKDLTENVQEYYAVQENSMSFILTNSQSYIDAVKDYGMDFPMNTTFNAINGPLQDSLWEAIDPEILQSKFNGMLTTRIFMFTNEKTQIGILLEKTQELIVLIEASLNKWFFVLPVIGVSTAQAIHETVGSNEQNSNNMKRIFSLSWAFS